MKTQRGRNQDRNKGLKNKKNETMHRHTYDKEWNDEKESPEKAESKLMGFQRKENSKW